MVAFIFYATVILSNIGLVFAQTAGGATPDDLGGWLALVNVGLAGVGLVAFVRGWIVPGVIHNQAIEREAEKEAEIQKLRTHLEEMVAEVMEFKQIQVDVTEVTNRFLKLIEDDRIRKEAQDKAYAEHQKQLDAQREHAAGRRASS